MPGEEGSGNEATGQRGGDAAMRRNCRKLDEDSQEGRTETEMGTRKSYRMATGQVFGFLPDILIRSDYRKLYTHLGALRPGWQLLGFTEEPDPFVPDLKFGDAQSGCIHVGSTRYRNPHVKGFLVIPITVFTPPNLLTDELTFPFLSVSCVRIKIF